MKSPLNPIEKMKSTIWDRETVKEQLIASGQWTALRARPFGKVADPATEARSIFVNAMDTNPLAPDMARVLAGQENNFALGLKIVSKLIDGTVFVCRDPELDLPEIDDDRVQVEEFSGPHPAGLVRHAHPLLRSRSPQQNSLAHRPSGCHSMGAFVHDRTDHDRARGRSERSHCETPQIDPHADGCFDNGSGRW